MILVAGGVRIFLFIKKLRAIIDWRRDPRSSGARNPPSASVEAVLEALQNWWLPRCVSSLYFPNLSAMSIILARLRHLCYHDLAKVVRGEVLSATLPTLLSPAVSSRSLTLGGRDVFLDITW